MTVYRPLVSGVLGRGADLDEGHLAQRHQPFKHPMEDPMSPDQFEKLKKHLEDIASGLATKEEYDAVIADISQQLSEMQKDLNAQRDANDTWSKRVEALQVEVTDAQARAEEAEKKAAEAQKSAAEAHQSLADAEAEIAEAEKKAADAEKALDEATKLNAKTTTKKDKSGGAH